jgi:hypothetical protein
MVYLPGFRGPLGRYCCKIANLMKVFLVLPCLYSAENMLLEKPLFTVNIGSHTVLCCDSFV